MLRSYGRWSSIVILAIAGFTPSSSAQQDRPGLRQQLITQRSPYSDPTINMGPWTMMGGNRNMYLFNLAAQHRAAQQLRQEEITAGRSEVRPGSSLHQQQPGGRSASSFFGRTKIINARQEPAPPARYNRYRHYFGGGPN